MRYRGIVYPDDAWGDPDEKIEHSVGPEQRLLATGRRLFAQRGYDGTTVRDLCNESDANVGAVNYYFGTKEQLFARVLHQVLFPLARRIKLTSHAKTSPLDRLEAIVRIFFEHIQANPDMPALMVREMAGDRELAAPVVEMLKGVVPMIAEIVAEGQRNGTIRAGDPVLLTLSIAAQPVYLNLARRGLAAAAGLDLADEATFARVVEHAVTVVRAFLEARR